MRPRATISRIVAAAALAAAFSSASAQPPAAADARPARGLIVKLKDAPAHEFALAADAAGRERAARESGRWERVLREARLQPQRLRPNGRDAQVLDFGRVLSADEAERLAAQLRARPDVEWVVPNVRERRLQVPPNDPYFVGVPDNREVLRQWWLYAAGGSDANVKADRLRGVPGFLSAWGSGIAGSTGVGSAAARVAIIDSGITSHPELAASRVLQGHDFVSDPGYANDGDGGAAGDGSDRDNDPSDPGDWVSAADRTADPARYSTCQTENSSWHGTIIAGQIAAITNNLSGVASINWQGQIVPVRVAGKCGADVADIRDGMRWAAGLAVTGAPTNPNPARILTISFGGTGDCAAYQDVIDELRARDVVIVAAAGNESSTATRPAKCPGVIGVPALNRDGFKASYSNFGPELAATGIATVGGDAVGGAWLGTLGDGGLLGIDNEGRTAPGRPGLSFVTGTSFSAPIVAGAISLMLSVNPALTYDDIVRGLRLSARPHVTSPKIGTCSAANPGRCICTTQTCGVGILDVAQALVFAQNPAAYTAPAWPTVLIDNADVDAALRVSALDVTPGGGTTPPSGGGGGGGGAMGLAWLAGLALATVLLAWPQRRGRPRARPVGRRMLARPFGRRRSRG